MAFQEYRLAWKALQKELDLREQEVMELKREREKSAHLGSDSNDERVISNSGWKHVKIDHDEHRETEKVRESNVVML